MKKCILLLWIVLGAVDQAIAQGALMDYYGTARFFSEAPLEDIEAVNKQVVGAIDLKKGTLAVSMFIKGFHFDKTLMEEHFNENYLESDQHSKATFKGVIDGFASLDFSKSGIIEAMAEGEVEIHGVKKPLKTKVKFDVSPGKLLATTTFHLAVADFDIDIPTLIFHRIAEVVEVKASFNFSRF